MYAGQVEDINLRHAIVGTEGCTLVLFIRFEFEVGAIKIFMLYLLNKIEIEPAKGKTTFYFHTLL